MRGFTLIELLLVLAITLFLSMLVTPFVIKKNTYLLEQELEKIILLCDYLSQRAMATNQTQELFIDVHKNCYFFVKNTKLITNRLPPEIVFSFLPEVFGPPGDPIAPIDQTITFPNKPQQNGLFSIQFFSNGKMSAGTAYLTDKEKKCMGALTCTSPQVSYIRRYIYKANRWILLNS